MKHERDFEEETSPSEAYKKAERLRMSLRYEAFTEMYERIKEKNPEGYEEKLRAEEVSGFYKNRALFDMALRDVTFDLVMVDVSIMNLTRDEQLRQIEAKMEQYAVDPAYRNKYAGMARG